MGKSARPIPRSRKRRVWASQQELAKARTGRAAPGTSRLTLIAWRSEWEGYRTGEQSTRAKQDSYWNAHIKPMWGNTRLTQITGPRLDGWVELMVRNDVGADTIHGAVNHLSAMLKAAVRQGHLQHNPRDEMAGKLPVIQPSESRPLTRDELTRIVAESVEPYGSMWLVAAHCGLRWAEFAAIPVRNVDLDAGTVTIAQTMTRTGTIKPYPKSRKPRVVNLTTDAAAALAPLVKGRFGNALVFTSPDGANLDYHNTRNRTWGWEDTVDKAGIVDPRPTMHDLRHTAGTWLGDGGAPVTAIRDFLGHATTRMAEKYTHTGAAQRERMADILQG